jgi:hypothetical protein
VAIILNQTVCHALPHREPTTKGVKGRPAAFSSETVSNSSADAKTSNEIEL